MTAQELKNSILQLAVQGKLVPQCKDDEPASELLKRIRAEKNKLGIKEKSLPAIAEDEIPFDIPENWEWARLNDISSITSGGTPARTNSTFWNGNIPWVKIGDIKNKYISTTEEKISEQGLNSSSAKIFPTGTILYTIFATIGTVGILNIDAATNQAVAGVTFFGEYNRDYMYYVLIGLKDILVSKGKGMAQMNINLTILKNTPIPIPPIAEQKRIVAKIEELMPLVEEYGKEEEQLSKLNAEFPDKLRKSILQQAVQGKLTERDPADEPASELLKRIKAEKEVLIKSGKIKKEKPLPAITDDEKPFDIPETWAWSSINELFWVTKLAGFEYTKYFTKEQISSENKVKIVRAQNVKMNRFVENDNEAITEQLSLQLERSALTVNCILMTFIGAGIGDTCLYCSPYRHHLAPNVAKIVPVIDNIYLPYYLIWLMSPIGQASVETIKKSTAQPSLSMETIRSIRVAVPPLSEQKRIVKRVEELLALCDELK